MAEEATNDAPWSPDARTMAKISEASFEFDDYWRVVDVPSPQIALRGFQGVEAILQGVGAAEFLLTHGPEDFAEEFYCDVDVIQELGTFQHVDDRGFDWGSSMRKKSERIAKLLRNGQFLGEAREKAHKVSSEIKGFGSSAPNSPTLSSSSPSSSSSSPLPSTPSSSLSRPSSPFSLARINRDQGSPISPFHERGSPLNPNANSINGKGKAALRTLSEVGKLMKKTFERQLSMGF